MITLDVDGGIATDVGEYWKGGADIPEPIIVGIYMQEEVVEFNFSVRGKLHTLGVPVDRLKRLLR
jgi:hypothetical protein